MARASGLKHMESFVEVARTSNFSRASANLEIPAPTLSRSIATMERELGVRLFDRTTRRVELTDAGRRYFERCAPLVDGARLASEALREAGTRPSGNLRISMPVDFGVFVAAPLLADFAHLHPDISIELDLSPKHTDLIGEHVDLAIRLGAVLEQQLVARRIGWMGRALFASSDYLQQRGTPKQPVDLVEHECVVLGSQRQARWTLQREQESSEVAVRGRLCVNNHGLASALAERGLGIVVLTPSLVRDSVRAGRLVPVLPEWTLSRMPVHAVTTSHLQPAGIRALVDFLAARMAAV